jgi:hypothetical protein
MMRQNTIGGGGRYNGMNSSERDDAFDGMTVFSTEREMVKIRVKLRYEGDVRGMVRPFCVEVVVGIDVNAARRAFLQI